jgi:hypothetical protein
LQEVIKDVLQSKPEDSVDEGWSIIWVEKKLYLIRYPSHYCAICILIYLFQDVYFLVVQLSIMYFILISKLVFPALVVRNGTKRITTCTSL